MFCYEVSGNGAPASSPVKYGAPARSPVKYGAPARSPVKYGAPAKSPARSTTEWYLCFLFYVEPFFASMKQKRDFFCFNEAKVGFKAKLQGEPDLTIQNDWIQRWEIRRLGGL